MRRLSIRKNLSRRIRFENRKRISTILKVALFSILIFPLFQNCGIGSFKSSSLNSTEVASSNSTSESGAVVDITSIKISNLESTAKSKAKFTFALPFKSGSIKSSESLIFSPPLDIQVDKKAFFSDGSLRHAIISGEVDLGALETKSFTIKSSPTTQVSPITRDQLLATAFEARIDVTMNGIVYSQNARSLLQSSTPYQWLSGPMVSEWIVGGSLKNANNEHPTLAGYFHIRAFKELRVVRVDFVVENGWYKAANSDVNYAVALSLNGQNVYSANLQHYAEARWHYIAFTNDPKVYTQVDSQYLQSTKAVPKYVTMNSPDTTNLPQSVLPLSGGVYGPSGQDMANAGDSPWIGPLPKWDSIYVNSTDYKSFKYMIMGNDSAGIFGCPGRYISGGAGIHMRDKATRQIVSVDLHPNASAGDSTPDQIPGCQTVNPYLKDSSHQPLIGYTPYLVTGDYYQLEEMAFWTGYNLFEANPTVHQFDKGILEDAQIRGVGWGYRSLGYAAYIFPDQHPLKNYFVEKLNNNIINDLEKIATKGNMFGSWFGGYFNWGVNEFTDYPVFMDAFLTWAVGNLVDLGFTQAQGLIAYKSKLVIGLMGGNGGTNGYCYQAAPLYRMKLGPTNTSLHSSWSEVYTATLQKLAADGLTAQNAICNQPCGSLALLSCLGTNTNDPLALIGAQSNTDYYYAEIQPALAISVQLGYGSLTDHWGKFRAATALPNYSNDPRFGIAPR